MRILFLSSWYPYPPNNGSKLRILNLLHGLAEQHDVTLLSFTDGDPVAPPPPELRSLCRDIQTVRRRDYHPGSVRSLLGLVSPSPRVIVDTFSEEMCGRLRQALDHASYDLIIASQWNTASYLDGISDVPAIFEEVEVGVLETKKRGASTSLTRLRHQLTLWKLQRYLRRLLRRFAACTVVSDAEAALLRRMVPDYGHVEVVPNGVDVTTYADVDARPRPKSLIFAGSFRYFANHDAMEWFLRAVYPLIQAQVPDVQLSITGDHANLPLPPARNVTLTGFVPDVRPLIASASASLAPIRLGGGTRLKILEAMALRSPVIATRKGAEGLEVENGTHLLLADSPTAFAQAAVRVLSDPDLRRHLADQGFELVQSKYDWPIILPNFLKIVDAIGKAP